MYNNDNGDFCLLRYEIVLYGGSMSFGENAVSIIRVYNPDCPFTSYLYVGSLLQPVTFSLASQ